MGDKPYVLGMDIGGTNTRFGLVDRDGGLKDFAILSTKERIGGGDPVGGLADAISAYLRERRAEDGIAAVSIGFPATIDRECKTVLSTPNIPGLQNVPVVELLESRLKYPVFIGRDANFLMLYDIASHHIDPGGAVIGLYFGTGIGNAVYMNGKILTGKNGVAAEIGHIPIPGLDEMCSCGCQGCLELRASGKYLERVAARDFPDIPIGEIFSRRAETPQIRGFVDNVAAAVAIEVNLFDPDWVILGGGVLQMRGFPRALLEERVRARARRPVPADNLRLIYSREAQENGVVGAGIYAFSKLER